MVLTKDEFMEQLKNIIGDKDDDATLAFIENCNDTLDGNDSNEWQKKYNEAIEQKDTLEKEWRKKYRDRFFSNSDDDENNNKNNPASKAHEEDDETDLEEQAKSVRFDDLFSEGKE